MANGSPLKLMYLNPVGTADTTRRSPKWRAP